jgi:hypothetical protein
VSRTATFRTFDTNCAEVTARFGFSLVSDRGLFRPAEVPASIPTDQAYYWSVPWQTDIRESMNALSAGEFEDFDSDDPNDVARWLLGGDDD